MGFQKIIPVVVVALLLAGLAGGISKKTRASVAPPIYDPISYSSKCKATWKTIGKKNYSGALNIEPHRPPGTAFILYPAGFKKSVKKFLFRSVFSQIAIWTATLVLLVVPLVRSRLDAALGTALMMGFMCLSLFYQFQRSEVYAVDYEWGLVDALEGTVAALAVALMVRGVECKSWRLCWLSWFVAAYTLFIKPSGLLVMMMKAMGGVELVILFLAEARERRGGVLRLGAWMFSGAILIYGGALALAMNSPYMDRQAISDGVAAQKIDLFLSLCPVLPRLSQMIRPVIGWWWFIPLAAMGVGCLFGAVRLLSQRRMPVAGFRLAISAVMAGAGIWWWTHLAGMETRFLLPILLTLLAWMVPDVFRGIQNLSPGATKGIFAYCILPVPLLVGLLYSDQPSVRLQQWLGVNLNYREFAIEVTQGEWLDRQGVESNSAMQVYIVGDGLRCGVVEMVSLVHRIEGGQKQTHPEFFHPNAWAGSPGLQLQKIWECDYILMEEVNPRGHSGDTIVPVSSWPQELEHFKEFTYGDCGAEKNGLEIVFDGKGHLWKPG
jgi:hypothetical protein